MEKEKKGERKIGQKKIFMGGMIGLSPKPIKGQY